MTSLLYPCRVWRKNTGPRESSLTASETASKSGENASRARPATDMSNARFASFFNRWLIFYDDVRQVATLDHIGELCVVGLEDNRILVKQMQPGRAEGLFNLLSPTERPIPDDAIKRPQMFNNLTPRIPDAVA